MGQTPTSAAEGSGDAAGWRGAPFRSPPSPGRGLRFTRLALLWLGAGLGADLLGQILQVGVLREQRSHGWRFGGRAALAPGSYWWGGEPGCSVPRRDRHLQTHTLPPAGATLSPSAAHAGNQHVGRRGRPSAEQPTRDARLTRWLHRKRRGGGGAQSIMGRGRRPRPAPGRCSVPVGATGTDPQSFTPLGAQTPSGSWRDRVRSERTARRAGSKAPGYKRRRKHTAVSS